MTQKTFIYCPNPLNVIQCSTPSFIFRFPNTTATDILINGTPEQNLIQWCKQFCDKQKIFIDIGAHAGTYAISLAPNCKYVHAFECQRETFYQLCGGVALNAQWNIYPYNVALGDECKENVTINIRSLDGGGTTLTDIKDSISTDKINMRTLDSYNISNVGFLKIDVEGFEENVLRGAVETLKNSNYPPFIFESWTEPEFIRQQESLYKFINELGYKIIPINGYPHMMIAEFEK